MSNSSQEFPAAWEKVKLRRKLRGGEGIRIGPFGSALTLDQMVDAGVKVYGQENVIENDFTIGERFVSSKKFSELKTCEVRPGDVLVTMMGTTGRCAIVPEGTATGLMDSHLIRLRFRKDGINPKFIAWLVTARMPAATWRCVLALLGQMAASAG